MTIGDLVAEGILGNEDLLHVGRSLAGENRSAYDFSQDTLYSLASP
jgi:hypothetical protein